MPLRCFLILVPLCPLVCRVPARPCRTTARVHPLPHLDGPALQRMSKASAPPALLACCLQAADADADAAGMRALAPSMRQPHTYSPTSAFAPPGLPGTLRPPAPLLHPPPFHVSPTDLFSAAPFCGQLITPSPRLPWLRPCSPLCILFIVSVASQFSLYGAPLSTD